MIGAMYLVPAFLFGAAVGTAIQGRRFFKTGGLFDVAYELGKRHGQQMIALGHPLPGDPHDEEQCNTTMTST